MTEETRQYRVRMQVTVNLEVDVEALDSFEARGIAEIDAEDRLQFLEGVTSVIMERSRVVTDE